MNRCRKRDAEEELPLRQIFDEVCRTVDAGGNDVAFATMESSMYKRRRYAKFAYQSTRRRRSDQGQSICVAGRCAVDTGDGDTTNSVLINYNQYYNKLIATL